MAKRAAPPHLTSLINGVRLHPRMNKKHNEFAAFVKGQQAVFYQRCISEKNPA
jgi:hypothetical protein